MRFLILFFITTSLSILGCKQTNESNDPANMTTAKIMTEEYDLTPIPGTNMQMAVKSDVDGLVIEQGMVENGLKAGTWAKFFPRNGKVMEIWNYAAGKLNGMHILLNNSGRVDMYETYIDNKLNGKRMTFKLGTPVEEMSYVNGKLDGIFRGFNPMGRIQRKGFYVNGVQDGDYFVYDDDGKVIMQVKYKNGQVVK